MKNQYFDIVSLFQMTLLFLFSIKGGSVQCIRIVEDEQTFLEILATLQDTNDVKTTSSRPPADEVHKGFWGTGLPP